MRSFCTKSFDSLDTGLAQELGSDPDQLGLLLQVETEHVLPFSGGPDGAEKRFTRLVYPLGVQMQLDFLLPGTNHLDHFAQSVRAKAGGK